MAKSGRKSPVPHDRPGARPGGQRARRSRGQACREPQPRRRRRQPTRGHRRALRAIAREALDWREEALGDKGGRPGRRALRGAQADLSNVQRDGAEMERRVLTNVEGERDAWRTTAESCACPWPCSGRSCGPWSAARSGRRGRQHRRPVQDLLPGASVTATSEVGRRTGTWSIRFTRVTIRLKCWPDSTNPLDKYRRGEPWTKRSGLAIRSVSLRTVDDVHYVASQARIFVVTRHRPRITVPAWGRSAGSWPVSRWILRLTHRPSPSDPSRPPTCPLRPSR